MAYSAIARIESYKHYQAGAVHKEAVRELIGYKNPNWDRSRTGDNIFFERMDIDKPFEKWIYEYREKNDIVGRYIEHSKNPKNETNCMCQFFATVPKYIDMLDRDEQIDILRRCYEFFKSEFPEVPILEACCHFDETSPHLQINFLPVVEREHAKRGKEKIFSTTLLMPGKDYFPKFQDRFYEYMESILEMDLERKKGSKIKHLAPKEFRELTSELNSLEKEKEQIEEDLAVLKSDYCYFSEQLHALQSMNSLDKTIRLSKENSLLKAFLSYVIDRVPYIGHLFERYRERHDTQHIISFEPVAQKPRRYNENEFCVRMNWRLQEQLDELFGTNYAAEDKRKYFEKSR